MWTELKIGLWRTRFEPGSDRLRGKAGRGKASHDRFVVIPAMLRQSLELYEHMEEDILLMNGYPGRAEGICAGRAV